MVASAPALDVFALRDSLVEEYKRFATSFTTIHAPDISEQVAAIYAEDRYWPEPLIQINPSYKRSADVGTLVSNGVLHPGCADIFRADGQPLSLYKHQEQAIALAAEDESFVVTTGTGSGKSLCFFIPIVSHVLAARRTNAQRRTQAIVVYPMNALANSQMEELSKFIDPVPGDRPITFARYTGQEDRDERRRVADEPPDILLTNFMMLELLMTRQEEVDRRVIGNCAGCEQELSENDSPPHVEHWRPLSGDPEHALHWRNLYLSCSMLETCDGAKGARPLKADDADPDPSVADRTQLRRLGRFH